MSRASRRLDAGGGFVEILEDMQVLNLPVVSPGSVRSMKRELMISETNGRISELRAKGYNIWPVGTDEFGFSVQRLFAEAVPAGRLGARGL